MIYKLSDRIWFGDRGGVVEGLGQVKSVINVAQNVRSSYWQNVSKLDWDVWYFRLASPDQVELADEYIYGMRKIIDAIEIARKFPLFCHCKMGGHRGPSVAVFAYWYLGMQNEATLEEALRKVEEFKPKFSRVKSTAVYKRCILDYCRRVSGVTT